MKRIVIIFGLILIVLCIVGCNTPKTCEQVGGYCQSRVVGHGCIPRELDFNDQYPCPNPDADICCAPK